MINFVIKFFYSWYIDDTKNFYNWLIDCFKTLDRDIGLVSNLQNWLSPLYGDYSFAGRIIGPVMRTLRIFFSLAFYFALAILFLIAYLIWIILPAAVIIMVFLNLLVLVKAPEPVFALGREILNLLNI